MIRQIPCLSCRGQKTRGGSKTKEDNRRRFNMLKGIMLVDSLGDMVRHRNRIEHFSDRTGLPVVEHRLVGLDGLKAIIEEALQRRWQ